MGSKTNAIWSSSVYGMTYVAHTNTTDPIFIFDAVNIEDTTLPAQTYEFSLTLAYKANSYTFLYKMSLPDRCSSPWGSIISTCPLDYNFVAYYDIWFDYTT